MTFGGKTTLGILMLLALFGAACGTETTDDAGGTDTETEGDSAESSDDGASQNACPAEGCTIGFESLAKSGDEIEVTWSINFNPDLNNNHVHIYWDNFEPGQVSNDATDRGVEQGEWVPTDSAPTYVTDGAVSTSVRGDSTTLCLVAADRDHNVLDVDAETCQDVSEYL